MTDFTSLPDLAARDLGGGAVLANDESFAEKENLVKPEAPAFVPHHFGPRGQVMDGWETRRRREPGHDWAILRLGAPGIVRGIVVDTAHFTGNYPESCAVDAHAAEGYPSPEELAGPVTRWVEIVPRSALRGNAENPFAVTSPHRFTHVRLRVFPDGGVARLRVHGDVVPDPRELLGRSFDLAASEHSGLVVECSDRFYSSPHHVNAPGRARTMGEGWETRRRRGGGNDWVALSLACQGLPLLVEVDTSCFVANAPGAFTLRGCNVEPPDAGTDASETADRGSADVADPNAWWEVIPRTRLQPDTRHRFRVHAPRPTTHVRLDIFPDGGLARLRVVGHPTPKGRVRLARRWFESLPADRALALAESGALAVLGMEA